MPPTTRRKRLEKGADAAERDLIEEREELSSSEMTQSTRIRTFSTWVTREWNLRETTQQRPRDLTSEILLKTRRRIESGRWSKWSVCRGSGWIREGGSERAMESDLRFGGKFVSRVLRGRIRNQNRMTKFRERGTDGNGWRRQIPRGFLSL